MQEHKSFESLPDGNSDSPDMFKIEQLPKPKPLRRTSCLVKFEDGEEDIVFEIE
jgi:hypothetical protein